MSDSAPAADFSALMNNAASAADAAVADAPYGYMTDPVTGEQRPKKAAGRPRTSPSLDELKAEKAERDASNPVIEGTVVGDRAPEQPKRGRRKKADEPKATEPVPQFRQGVIAKGMNKLYRRAGKIVKVMDPVVGAAIIETTRADDDDDLTVGEAWEEVARHNPRIRRVLLMFLKGGAWGQLFWVHAPILLAILMKDAIRSRIPFASLMTAFLDDGDEDGETPSDGTPFEGVSSADMGEAMAFAQQMMGQMMSGRGMQMPRMPVPAEDAEAA